MCTTCSLSGSMFALWRVYVGQLILPPLLCKPYEQLAGASVSLDELGGLQNKPSQAQPRGRQRASASSASEQSEAPQANATRQAR